MSPFNAWRAVSSTSAASTRTRTSSAGSAVAERGLVAERRHRIARLGRDADHRHDEPREDQAEHEPGDRAERDQHERAGTQLVAQRPRRHALRLEVEQLAALVARFADEREQEADGGEQDGDQAGRAERERDPPRERLGVELVLQVTARGNLERGERAAGERVRHARRGGGAGHREPELVGNRRPRRIGREGGREMALLDDHEPLPLVVRVGESARDPDDLRRHLGVLEVEGDQPAGGRGLRDLRADEHLQRVPVGRLRSPDDHRLAGS